MTESPIHDAFVKILHVYPCAARDWDAVLAPHSPSPGRAEFMRGDDAALYNPARVHTNDELSAWADRLFSREAEPVDWAQVPRKAWSFLVQPGSAREQHVCSRCKTASFALRRCGACRAVRYCNEKWLVFTRRE